MNNKVDSDRIRCYDMAEGRLRMTRRVKVNRNPTKARKARLVPPPGCERWLTPPQLRVRYGGGPNAWGQLIRAGRVVSVKAKGMYWVSPESAEAFIRAWRKEQAARRGPGRPRTFRLTGAR